MAKGDVCRINDCERIIGSPGMLCGMHRGRLSRLKKFDLPERKLAMDKRPCIAPGCDRKSKTSNMCGMHYDRMRKTNSFELKIMRVLPKGIVKICKIHGKISESQSYTKIKRKFSVKDGWHPELIYCCVACSLTTDKEKEKKLKEKSKRRDQKRKLEEGYKEYRRSLKLKLYGLTIEDYQRMYDAQEGKCAICKKSETAMKNNSDEVRELGVDHDHDKGFVRSLLCARHNLMIGYSGDSPEILEAAAQYLRRHGK